MTLKKINPEGLVVGREYYVKMKHHDTDDDSVSFRFRNGDGTDYWFPKDQPIYTLEQTADTDLEMLVNVASRIYTDQTFEDGIEEATMIAKDLITACKNALKEGER